MWFDDLRARYSGRRYLKVYENLQIEPYEVAAKYLLDVISFIQKRNSGCLYHVFIHKADPEQQNVEDKKNGTVIIMAGFYSDQREGER